MRTDYLSRTHCNHGHAFDAANTYYYPPTSEHAGARECKKCRQLHSRKMYERVATNPRPYKPRDPFLGHVFSDMPAAALRARSTTGEDNG